MKTEEEVNDKMEALEEKLLLGGEYEEFFGDLTLSTDEAKRGAYIAMLWIMSNKE